MFMPMIRSFEVYEEADAARAEMLAAGLPADELNLRVIQDEAGPVEGNFLVGNGRAADDDPYTTNFEKAVTRGTFLLEVHSRDAGLRDVATGIFQRHPCTDAIAAGNQAAPG